MKPYTKMMLLTYGKRSGDERTDRPGVYPREEGGYDIESRFRDRRGREHYDDGRFAPMRSPARRGERRGVRNDGGDMGIDMRGGREPRMEDDDDDVRGDHWPLPPYTIPPYGGGDDVNEIGFERGVNAHYEGGNEMENRYSEKKHGYAMGAGEFTHETAKEWTRSMRNEDGTQGPHWTMDQAKQVMAQRGLKHDPVIFWAILNSIYSDYCAVFKKHGVNTMDMYVDMAKAWMDDKDAVKDKAGAYFEYVVKH